MKIRYSPRAVADLEAIANYLAPINPQALKKVKAAIIDSLAQLSLFPNIGRRQTRRNVRKLVVRKYKYIIFYTCDEAADEIRIITVLHYAQTRPYSDR